LKIARKNSKNTGLSYRVEIFQEREWSGGCRGKWRARGPTPCHGSAWPWPRHHVVWWHGGSPWGVPGASLPHFLHKNLKRILLNFSRNFIFEDFSEIHKRLKLGKTKMNDRKQIQTKATTTLSSNMKLNSGNKNEQGGEESKCGENIGSFIRKPLC
jgi:hypothetical protein